MNDVNAPADPLLRFRLSDQYQTLKSNLHRFLITAAPVARQYGRTVAAIEGADLRHNEGYALRLRGVTTVTNEAPTPRKK